MSVTISVLLIVLGLVALGGGGELLVRGAVNVARLAGLTPAVIGLTVVAFGTSVPELVVSLLAAFDGQPDISMGNVVGSNIFNIVVSLGIAAAISPIVVRSAAVRQEWPFMFLVSFLLLLLVRDGSLDRLEGGFFVVSLIAFIGYSVVVARREVRGEEAAAYSQSLARRAVRRHGRRTIIIPSIYLVAGVLLLVVGGRLLVDGAVALARLAGMTERIIALTIVAAGTSMPELATTVIAAFRRQADIAVANMIGSNIFNVLAILGITALIIPIPVSEAMISTDIWWMLGTSALLFPLMRSGWRITRLEGWILMAVYAVYLFLLLR